MKRVVTTLLGLIILLLVGCSNEEIPNHLVFEGKSEHWHPKLEIKQSNNENRISKYNYSISMIAKYIGEDAEKLERTEDVGVEWYIESDDHVEEDGGTYSDFQRQIGNAQGGSLTETNASEFYTPEDAEMKLVIKWGNKEEVIPLKNTIVEYSK